jgi:hypothetical protein
MKKESRVKEEQLSKKVIAKALRAAIPISSGRFPAMPGTRFRLARKDNLFYFFLDKFTG